MSKVHIYASGIVYCSVCAPDDMTRKQIEQEVNQNNPTGLQHGWRFSDNERFANGDPNPRKCEQDGESTHYLMVC